jgi:UDP-N-acetylglucosamine:LPS N-acetylglucosamine transferase
MRETANGAKRLLFLFSDTGGGHRSTARAVAQALQSRHGDRVQVELVDALAEYAPWPFNHPTTIYPKMLCLKGLVWIAGFHLSDGPRRVKLPAAGWELVTGTAMRQLLREHPADLVISCHAAFNHLLRHLLSKGSNGTRLVTLVTDLTAAHAFWFAPGVTRCLVPTADTRLDAMTRGLPKECVLETGLPVRACFAEAAREDSATVRRRLGLRADLPVVLLVSGAEGMWSPRRLYRSVANRGIQALVMGLPIVLSGALPGHERPNVDYVVRAGAGVWAPTPEQAARKACELLVAGNPQLTQMAACARALARPGAARRVAEILWDIACEELA